MSLLCMCRWIPLKDCIKRRAGLESKQQSDRDTSPHLPSLQGHPRLHGSRWTPSSPSPSQSPQTKPTSRECRRITNGKRTQPTSHALLLEWRHPYLTSALPCACAYLYPRPHTHLICIVDASPSFVRRSSDLRSDCITLVLRASRGRRILDLTGFGSDFGAPHIL